MSLVIALDVGGTNIRGELVDPAGTVHAASHEPTAGSDGDATLDAIERVCRALLVEAGELGHVVIREDGLECPCGQRGCLERYCSAPSIGIAYAAATGHGPRRRDAATSLEVVQALESDPLADAVWNEAITALALGILGVITLLGTARNLERRSTQSRRTAVAEADSGMVGVGHDDDGWAAPRPRDHG